MSEPPSAIEIAKSCLCGRSRRTTRAVTDWYEYCLAPTELSSPQLGLLTAVRLMQPTSLSDVAMRMDLDRTTLYRNIRPLLDRGLARELAGPDGRTKHVELTAEGDAKLREAIDLWRTAQDQLAQRMGPEQAALLGPLLTLAHRSARQLLQEHGGGESSDTHPAFPEVTTTRRRPSSSSLS